ncbi:MAG: hypothetical protein PHS47_04045 [Methanocellales archaeon]|nr:hypothetical protein [Methanocellales archaeon]MDD5446379.1 hypothetical protein [Methanocellales archaeon]
MKEVADRAHLKKVYVRKITDDTDGSAACSDEDVRKKIIGGTTDETDGSTVYTNESVIGFGLRACNKRIDEAIYIQVYDPHKARSGDKRDALMEIYHSHKPPPNCSVDPKHITICIDLKNHLPGQPFHINVEGISKNTSDSYFINKFIKNHPEGLDHMPIPFKKGIGKGKPYKIAVFDHIVDHIILFIRDQNIFRDFPILQLEAFNNPSNYEPLKERLTKLNIGRISKLTYPFE